MTKYQINIIRGIYKNKGIVYVIDIWNNGDYYGAWMFDKIEEVLNFIKECDNTKYGMPKLDIPKRRTSDKKIIVKRKVRKSPRSKTKRYSINYDKIKQGSKGETN